MEVGNRQFYQDQSNRIHFAEIDDPGPRCGMEAVHIHSTSCSSSGMENKTLPIQHNLSVDYGVMHPGGQCSKGVEPNEFIWCYIWVAHIECPILSLWYWLTLRWTLGVDRHCRGSCWYLLRSLETCTWGKVNWSQCSYQAMTYVIRTNKSNLMGYPNTKECPVKPHQTIIDCNKPHRKAQYHINPHFTGL